MGRGRPYKYSDDKLLSVIPDGQIAFNFLVKIVAERLGMNERSTTIRLHRLIKDNNLKVVGEWKYNTKEGTLPKTKRMVKKCN